MDKEKIYEEIQKIKERFRVRLVDIADITGTSYAMIRHKQKKRKYYYYTENELNKLKKYFYL